MSNARNLSFAVMVVATTLGFNKVAQAEPIIGWDVSTLPGGTNNFGPSPLAPTTLSGNVTATTALTRGSGVSTTGSGAARGWGGTNWNLTSTPTAGITANKYVTFGLTVGTGTTLSLTTINENYRRINSGPTKGLWQYSLNGGAYSDIATVNFINSSDSGGTIPPIVISGIAALQSMAAGTAVTFRIVPYGATGAAGPWYVFDTANTTANDLWIDGTFTILGVSGNFWDTNNTTSGIGGAGNWVTGGPTWATTSDGTSVGSQASSGALIFGGTVGTGAVTITDAVSASSGLQFSATGYTISGGTALNLTGSNATANTITTDNNVTATINSPLAGANGMTKAGPGTLILSGANTYNGGATVTGGTLVFDGPTARPNNAGILTFGKTSLTPPATGGVVIYKNTGKVAADIQSGLHSGTITGSLGNTERVGYLTGGQYNALHTVNSLGLETADVILKYTYSGDTTLKGYVDASDFAQIDASYLKDPTTDHTSLGHTWIQGDFNYDGMVNSDDFILIDAGYTASQLHGNLAADPFLAGNAALLGINLADYTGMVAAQLAASPAPEPASLALLGLGAVALLRRRR